MRDCLLGGTRFDLGMIRYCTSMVSAWATLQADDVTESGTPAGKTMGVKLLRTEEDAAVYEVGSGNYVFDASYHRKVETTVVK